MKSPIHFLAASIPVNQACNMMACAPEDVPLIRKADLENHNKDGGLWVVVDNRVYDLKDFHSQAPCGSETLLQYAGKFENDVALLN